MWFDKENFNSVKWFYVNLYISSQGYKNFADTFSNLLVVIGAEMYWWCVSPHANKEVS